MNYISCYLESASVRLDDRAPIACFYRNEEEEEEDDDSDIAAPGSKLFLPPYTDRVHKIKMSVSGIIRRSSILYVCNAMNVDRQNANPH